MKAVMNRSHPWAAGYEGGFSDEELKATHKTSKLTKLQLQQEERGQEGGKMSGQAAELHPELSAMYASVHSMQGL
jgi:hypothetical protein